MSITRTVWIASIVAGCLLLSGSDAARADWATDLSLDLACAASSSSGVSAPCSRLFSSGEASSGSTHAQDDAAGEYSDGLDDIVDPWGESSSAADEADGEDLVLGEIVDPWGESSSAGDHSSTDDQGDDTGQQSSDDDQGDSTDDQGDSSDDQGDSTDDQGDSSDDQGDGSDDGDCSGDDCGDDDGGGDDEGYPNPEDPGGCGPHCRGGDSTQQEVSNPGAEHQDDDGDTDGPGSPVMNPGVLKGYTPADDGGGGPPLSPAVLKGYTPGDNGPDGPPPGGPVHAWGAR